MKLFNRMNCVRFVSPIAASLALLAGVASAAPVTITDVAPKDSMVVVSIDNMNATWDAFNRTGFKAVWDEPSIQKWVEESMSDIFKDAAKDLEKLGIDKDELKRPTGPCGMAMWFDYKNRTETDEPTPHMVMLAEYANDAAAMDTVVKQIIEKGEKDKVLELTQSEYDGVTILSIKFIEQPEEAAPEGGDEEEELNLDEFGDEGGPAGMDFKEMHYALSGTVLLAASTKEHLETAIDRSKGKAGESVDDNAEYQQIVKQLGDQQARGVLLTKGIMEEMAREFQDAGGADAENAKKMFETMGISELRGVAGGVRFDADKAMMEQTIIVSTPAKKGIMALLDTPATPLEAPAFVPADAASMFMMQVDFPGIVPLIEKIVGTLPDEDGGQAAAMVGGISQMLGPILANLGPQMYIVSEYARPFSAESQQVLVAMKARDAQALTNAISTIGAQFGMQSRDFQGNQIWSMEGGMMPIEISIGVGGGHAFFGTGEQVENALRQTAAGEAGAAGRLSSQPGYKAAVASLPNTGIGFGYLNTKQTVQFLEWSLKNMDKIMEAQIDQQIESFGGMDEDQAKEFKKQMMEEQLKAVWPPLRNLPSLDVVLKHVGDSVTDVQSTPEGFTAKTRWLKPAGK